MASRIHPSAVVAALGLAGCPADGYDFGSATAPTAPGATSSGTTADVVPTGGPTVDVQTVTSGTTEQPVPGDTSTSTTGGPGGPMIFAFDVEPKQLNAAGAAEVSLVTGPPAQSFELLRNGELVGQGPIAAFAEVFEATTAKDNGEYLYAVTVSDGEGGTEMASTKLKVVLPDGGAVRCSFTEATGAGSKLLGLTRSGDAWVAVGTFINPAGQRLALWKLDATTCAPLPGWPRVVTSWTAIQDLGLHMSEGTAIGADALGHLAVAGLVGEDLERRPYLALLDDDGALLWEKLGAPGDEIHGAAIAPPPYGSVIAVGTRQTATNPLRHDAMVWHHLSKDSVVVDQIKAPLAVGEDGDLPNHRSERALAALVHPKTAVVFVAGERDYKDDQSLIYPRSFVLRYAPLGGRLGAWTSSGDYLPHDGARALASCDDGLRLGGWARSKDGEQPQPLTRWLDDQGASVQRRPEGYVNTRTLGLACDRIGRTVSAATRDADGLLPRAELFAFPDAAAPLSWTANGGINTVDAAFAVACDDWGFCAWAGFQHAGQPPQPRAHLRVLQP